MGSALQQSGWVYVLETDDIPYFKLGFTTDLGKRIGDLATGLPFDIEVRLIVSGTRSEERRCHRLLNPYRKRNEWYCATPEVIAFVDDLEFARQDHDSITNWLKGYRMPAPMCVDSQAPYDPSAYWWER